MDGNMYKQYNDLFLMKMLLTNDENYKSRYSFCDYCGKSFSNRDINLEIEDETVSSDLKSGLFGGMVVEKKWHYRLAKMCPRCKKVHKVVGWFHYLSWIILSIGFVVWAVFVNGVPFGIGILIAPFFIVGLCVFFISRINWLFIRLIFGVRRKPKIDYYKYMNDI